MLGFRNTCKIISQTAGPSCLVQRSLRLPTSCFTRNLSSHILDKEALLKKYDEAKESWQGKRLPSSIDPRTVFACNELDLSSVEVYGFDYDYTLANYNNAVEFLLFDLAKQKLVDKFKYPAELLDFQYDPAFAIIGLHYDIRRGLLMKLDHFQQIQTCSLYRGYTALSEQQMKEVYPSGAVPMAYVESHLNGGAEQQMAHVADCFTLPEMCLLSQINQYFEDKQLQYHAASIYSDVKSAVGASHPEMHALVQQNVAAFLKQEPELNTFFRKLRESGKEVFLITNSPFTFVNAGMTHLLGPSWRDNFDVVIAEAHKPQFFSDAARPFREYDIQGQMKSWAPVRELRKDSVYVEGSLTALQRVKQWRSDSVLYFGDHPYSDLADLTIRHGWRTGAIMWELEHELACLNAEEYKRQSGWQMMLQALLEEHQHTACAGAAETLAAWRDERNSLRIHIKAMFNARFGSIFRTHFNPTYFSRRLFRFADVYTSRVTNLNHYSLKHKFYPRRGVLPHDYKNPFV